MPRWYGQTSTPLSRTFPLRYAEERAGLGNKGGGRRRRTCPGPHGAAAPANTCSSNSRYCSSEASSYELTRLASPRLAGANSRPSARQNKMRAPESAIRMIGVSNFSFTSKHSSLFFFRTSSPTHKCWLDVFDSLTILFSSTKSVKHDSIVSLCCVCGSSVARMAFLTRVNGNQSCGCFPCSRDPRSG